MTKTYRTWYWVLTIICVLLNIAPLLTYTCIALFSSALIVEKVALCGSVFVVLIMTGVSLVNKVAMKSRIWVLLLGLYLCLQNIITPLLVIAICQVVDELLASPIRNRVREKLVINKELDKRLAAA